MLSVRVALGNADRPQTRNSFDVYSAYHGCPWVGLHVDLNMVVSQNRGTPITTKYCNPYYRDHQEGIYP